MAYLANTDLRESAIEMASPHLRQITSRRGRWGDRIFVGITRLAGLVVLLIIAGIFVSLVIGAWPALKKFGLSFLTRSTWNPVKKEFGGLVAIYGTLVTSALAIFIGVPVSFGIALFITELCPRGLTGAIKTAVELLAAIPSIIYGMWGLFVFAPIFGDFVQPWITEHIGRLPLLGRLFQGPPMGIGIATAGIVLGIMVIPFMSSVMCELFEAVPAVLKEAMYGLGATTWEVFRHVAVPYTKKGLVGAIMLGLGRALGETMAVTFVIGNTDRISVSLFMPGNTISSALANQFTEADGQVYTAALIELGLILFLMTLVILSAAKLMLLHFRRREGKIF